MDDLNKAITERINEGIRLEATRLKNELQLKIQPRPRWLPERLWFKVLARVLWSGDDFNRRFRLEEIDDCWN